MNQLAVIDLFKLIDNNDCIIIDVRDGDFEGGNLKTCVNIPYSQFNIDEFIKFTKSHAGRKLVMHCMYSSIRGPGCVNRVTKFIKNNITNYDKSNIYLLKGGFFGAINYAIDNNKLDYIDNFDPEYWIKQENNYCHKSEIIL